MPTLYIRNVPQELYERLKELAAASGRSLNAEVLDMLAREAERHPRIEGDWFERMLAFRDSLGLSDEEAREAADFAIASIRAHRDAEPPDRL